MKKFKHFWSWLFSFMKSKNPEHEFYYQLFVVATFFGMTLGALLLGKWSSAAVAGIITVFHSQVARRYWKLFVHEREFHQNKLAVTVKIPPYVCPADSTTPND